MDVIDPTYVPSLEYQDSFRAKQRFMCNVFSTIVLITKGRNGICDEFDSMNAQKVYVALWKPTMISFPDLEGIEDNQVDDETKCTWITNTLSFLNAAIRQAIITELTIHGTKMRSTKTSVPWTS
jgi:hypothetical protein